MDTKRLVKELKEHFASEATGVFAKYGVNARRVDNSAFYSMGGNMTCDRKMMVATYEADNAVFKVYYGDVSDCVYNAVVAV